jgi:hypothetical protein
MKYKIKLVHLQTTQNEHREKLSRKSVQQVIPYGIEYVLHQNELYTSLPPVHTSVRPHNVRMGKYEDVNDPEYGNALTPTHYGCFEAFKIGILSEFDNDLDFLIVCEGEKTEPNYFREIRAAHRLHTANVEVQPSELGTAPIQVVQYAQTLFKNGDRQKWIFALKEANGRIATCGR